MNLDSEKITFAFIKAHEVLEDLTIPAYAEGPVTSIDQLLRVVSARSGLNIDMYEVQFEGKFIRGRTERWKDGRVTIHVRSNEQDDDWKRFVAAKELMHLVVDGAEDLSPYGDATLEEMILEGHFGLIAASDPAKPPVQSEIIAQIAALEVLYPLKFRQGDVEALAKKETTFVKLAKRYGIPSSFVSTALHVPYLTAISRAFRETRAKNGR